jgi:hypothetical protein
MYVCMYVYVYVYMCSASLKICDGFQHLVENLRQKNKRGNFLPMKVCVFRGRLFINIIPQTQKKLRSL